MVWNLVLTRDPVSQASFFFQSIDVLGINPTEFAVIIQTFQELVEGSRLGGTAHLVKFGKHSEVQAESIGIFPGVDIEEIAPAGQFGVRESCLEGGEQPS